jgi:Protein of unknown function (DUF1553)/Protein of unknown function (DUF1549)/Planctomycete cytochrome C
VSRRVALSIFFALAIALPTSAAPPIDRVNFGRDVHPILSDHCFRCHGPDPGQRKAKFRLDDRDSAVKKGAIVPGKPAESELIARITADNESERMPPADSGVKPLSAAQIDVLKRWIEQGAEYRGHWAFIAPTRPPLPLPDGRGSERKPIDQFILAKVQAAGLQPSPEADPVTLVRRVTLDLTGLPPTPAEVDAYLADTRPDRYERLVDRLLASPRYGERMALDWLDAARFADTHGYHIDSARDMTRWREWVIRAFNANKPFDEFTVEQLAGDLLPNATIDQKVASGFNRNHMINFEGGAIPDEYLTAYIVDRVNTTATVWMGLTLGCAQCHDHKYDPFTQKEYYQLYAFFHNLPEKGLDGKSGNAAPVLRMSTPAEDRVFAAAGKMIRDSEAALRGPLPAADVAQADWEKDPGRPMPGATAALRAALANAPEKRTEGQKSELRQYFRSRVWPTGKAMAERIAALQKSLAEAEKTVPTAMVMQELPQPRETFLLVRGQYDKKGEKVTAATPASLPPLPPELPHNRLGLARWLVDPANPLTARVAVNRLWQTFFGTGLVKTAEDFGSQGEWPSHPELLDWLAVEFRESGWDVKHMVRLIVTSRTYRQSAAVTPAVLAKDPENRLLARMTRLRLPAEVIRDQALAASGLLNGVIGGRSVSPYQPPGIWEELMARADGKNFTAQEYVQDHGPALYRRTMYTFWKRTAPPPSLITLDAPDRETCTVRRSRTNTPLQALVLMNDPTYVEAARKLAERALAQGGPTADERIAFIFRLVTARKPNADEVSVLRRVLDRQLARYRSDPAAAGKLLGVGESPRDARYDVAETAAWTIVATTILNLDEAVTRG